MIKDIEPFWSSFKIWLQDKDLILSSELEEFDESGEGISVSASKRLGPALELYIKQNANVEPCSRYIGADNYDDSILQKLLIELSKVEEYPDGSEMVSNVNCFNELRIAASEYVNKNRVVFPPEESYVDVLPFHYDSEKDKFRKQLERKKK